MDKDSQLILLASNVEKLEKLLDDLVDNVESKRKKIRFLTFLKDFLCIRKMIAIRRYEDEDWKDLCRY